MRLNLSPAACLFLMNLFGFFFFASLDFRRKPGRCVVLQLLQLTLLHTILNRWSLAYEQLLNLLWEWPLVETQRFLSPGYNP